MFRFLKLESENFVFFFLKKKIIEQLTDYANFTDEVI